MEFTCSPCTYTGFYQMHADEVNWLFYIGHRYECECGWFVRLCVRLARYPGSNPASHPKSSRIGSSFPLALNGLVGRMKGWIDATSLIIKTRNICLAKHNFFRCWGMGVPLDAILNSSFVWVTFRIPTPTSFTRSNRHDLYDVNPLA